jgi:tetratricopeptide (TPR) repeat protein
MTGLVAVALVWALSSPLEAEAPAGDKGLAAELLAQSDGPARERWLDAHRAQLTAGLGREVAAQARVLYLASRYDPAYEAFTLALRIGEIAADPESRIRGLEGLGGVERFRGRAQEALPLLERAMQEAEAIGDEAAVGRVLGGIGSAKRRLGEYGAALALFEHQLAIFERLGDADGRARAENNIGIALGALGRCAEAVPYLDKSRAAFEAAGNAAGLSNVYNNLGLCHQLLGNYAAGL